MYPGCFISVFCLPSGGGVEYMHTVTCSICWEDCFLHVSLVIPLPNCLAWSRSITRGGQLVLYFHAQSISVREALQLILYAQSIPDSLPPGMIQSPIAHVEVQHRQS